MIIVLLGFLGVVGTPVRPLEWLWSVSFTLVWEKNTISNIEPQMSLDRLRNSKHYQQDRTCLDVVQQPQTTCFYIVEVFPYLKYKKLSTSHTSRVRNCTVVPRLGIRMEMERNP